MRARAALLLASLALASGCWSSRHELRPIAPLVAPDAGSAWSELLRIRRSPVALVSYSSIRIESRGSRQSFRATIAAGEKGRLRFDAFSPLGTAVFTLFVEGAESTMVDHVNRTWWRGPFATAARSLGLPESLDAGGLSMLAFGLPVSEDDGLVEGERVEQNGVTYSIGPSGIAEAKAAGWTAQFEVPAYPASGVTIVTLDGERSMSVRHLEVGTTTGAIEPPKIDPSYRCCVAPAGQ